MLSYSDEPEVTAQSLVEADWLRTGDIGQLGGSCRLIFTGRFGAGNNSRVFNVSREEFKHVFAQLEGVTLCAVVCSPDGIDYNIATAYVI